MDNKMQLQTSTMKSIEKVYKRAKDIELVLSIAFANSNTDFDSKKINNTMSAMNLIEFEVTEEEIITAIKFGATGKFGKPYGKLSIMDICIWIREHIKTLGYRSKKVKQYKEMTLAEKVDFKNKWGMQVYLRNSYTEEQAEKEMKGEDEWTTEENFYDKWGN